VFCVVHALTSPRSSSCFWAVLGKEETVARMRRAVEVLK
jgi:hypothetical protein